MSLNIHVELKEGYLYLLVEGTYDYPSLVNLSDISLKACAEHHVSKVLVDFRKMVGLPTDSERYAFAEQAAMKHDAMVAVGKIKRCRFAYLALSIQEDRKKLVETVSVNRGMLTIVTTDMKVALDWLVVEPEHTN